MEPEHLKQMEKSTDAVLFEAALKLREDLGKVDKKCDSSFQSVVSGLKFFKRAITVGVLIIAAASALGLWLAWEQTKKGEQAQKAVCAQYTSVQKQVQSSEQFLDDLHKGKRKPIPGISEADIQSGIDRQRDFLRAIDSSGLDCQP